MTHIISESPAQAQGMLDLQIQCPDCKRVSKATVPSSGYRAWREGKQIRRAMPWLRPEQETRLIDGTCVGCQEVGA